MGLLAEAAKGRLTETEETRKGQKLTLIESAGRALETRWADKYPDFVKVFEGDNDNEKYKAATTIQMLENMVTLTEGLDKYQESVVQASLGALNPRVLDVVRIFYPNQIAQELVDIQPLNGQIGQIFVMKPRYAGPVDGVPGVNVGQEMFKPGTYPTHNNYASEQSYQQIGLGDASTTSFTYILAPLPIRPGTVRVVAGSVVATDTTTLGTLAGTGVSSGSVDYNTGVITITFSSAPSASVPVVADWRYSSEIGETQIRSVEFDLNLIPVQAKIYPLNYKYSVAAGLAASAHLAIDVQDTLANTAATYLKIERDNKIVKLIYDNASLYTNLNFNCDMTGKNYDKRSFFGEIEIKIDEALSIIQSIVGRGGLDFILAGRNATNVFAQCRSFRAEPVRAPIGSYKFGTLRDGTIALIRSLTLPADVYVFGFKGYMAGDAATVLAEWIPMYATPLFQNPTFNNSAGLCSLYDLFVNNASYYVYGTLSNYTA